MRKMHAPVELKGPIFVVLNWSKENKNAFTGISQNRAREESWDHPGWNTPQSKISACLSFIVNTILSDGLVM